MGEVSSVIQKIREDKNNFGMLLERMKPLINKYTKLLYKDEKRGCLFGNGACIMGSSNENGIL
mgnify:CR=1 FL=1